MRERSSSSTMGLGQSQNTRNSSPLYHKRHYQQVNQAYPGLYDSNNLKNMERLGRKLLITTDIAFNNMSTQRNKIMNKLTTVSERLSHTKRHILGSSIYSQLNQQTQVAQQQTYRFKPYHRSLRQNKQVMHKSMNTTTTTTTTAKMGNSLLQKGMVLGAV